LYLYCICAGELSIALSSQAQWCWHAMLWAMPPVEFSPVCLVLQDVGAAARITYCFSFFDQPDCDSFTAALQAMLDRQQQQQQQQQPPQHHDSSTLQQASQQAQAAGIQPPLQQAGNELGAMAPVAPHASQLTPAAAANELELLADAKEAVKVGWQWSILCLVIIMCMYNATMCGLSRYMCTCTAHTTGISSAGMTAMSLGCIFQQQLPMIVGSLEIAEFELTAGP
jgi:hypothetical protein